VLHVEVMRLAIILSSAVMAGFAALDAARRGRSWYAWSRIVFFTNVIGLLVWLGTRRRSPVTDVAITPVRGAALAVAGVPLALLVLLLSATTTAFVIQPARVNGGAMAPTVAAGSRVLVNKLAYRFGRPRRGDVVMLYYPLNPEQTFIKRVIGEEGDSIRIRDGRVFLNDTELKEDAYVPADARSHDDWGPAVVPEGYYFVMGDHRNNSSDSRHWGFVPARYIVGKVMF
jgi:signal peptidase I